MSEMRANVSMHGVEPLWVRSVYGALACVSVVSDIRLSFLQQSPVFLRTLFLMALLGMGMSYEANAGSEANAVEIRLHEEARLEGRTFTLGDIADLEFADAALASRLRGVMMGRVPRTGVAITIDRDAVVARAERAQPGIAKQLLWKGPMAVRVLGVHHAFDRQNYLDAAQQRLEDWLIAQYDDFSVRPVGRYEDLRLPAGPVDVQAELAGTQRLGKRMCVWIDVRVEGEHYTSVPVWFDVRVDGEAYVLRRDASSGALLIPEMLQSVPRDLAAISGVPVVDLSLLEGQRLTRDLAKGAVLTEGVLQPVPDVVKGQQIRVRSVVGKVTLFAKARALADGNQGDPVRVERLDGADSYMTRVIGNGLTEVAGISR